VRVLSSRSYDAQHPEWLTIKATITTDEGEILGIVHRNRRRSRQPSSLLACTIHAYDFVGVSYEKRTPVNLGLRVKMHA